MWQLSKEQHLIILFITYRIVKKQNTGFVMLVLEHKQHFFFSQYKGPAKLYSSTLPLPQHFLGFSTSTNQLSFRHFGDFPRAWCVLQNKALRFCGLFNSFTCISRHPQTRPGLARSSTASGLPNKSSHTKADTCWWAAVPLWHKAQLRLGCEPSGSQTVSAALTCHRNVKGAAIRQGT